MIGTRTREDDDDDWRHFQFGSQRSGRSVIGSLYSWHRSGGSTEDDPIGPVRPSAAPTMAGGTISHKATAIDFSRMISAYLADLEDKEWVDLTPIPAIPLEPAPPTFPLPTAKAKSSSSAKSCKRKDAREHLTFPSSARAGRGTSRGACYR